LGPSERVDEIKAARITLFDLGLQGVVTAESTREGFFDGGEVRNGTARVDREIGSGGRARRCLVGVGQDHQTYSVIAQISDIQEEIMREFAFYRKMPRLHVAGAIVCWDVANLGGSGVERGGRCEIVRKAESRGTETSAWCIIYRCASACALARDLIDDGIYHVRAIVGEKIFATEAVELYVADAVCAANDHLGSNAICQADPRRPIVVNRVHQCAIVKTSCGR